MDSGFAASRRAGMTSDAVVADLTRAYGYQRIDRERRLDALIARSVALHPAGFAAIDRAALAGVEAELAERLLGRVAACIGGAHYPARRARLAGLRLGLAAQPDRGRTLGGCRFLPWRGQVLVLRELAAASAPVRLEPGARLGWDRRFVAELPAASTSGFTLGYLGQTGAPAIASGTAAAIDRDAGDLPRLVHHVLPAWWDAEGLAGVPALRYRRGGVRVLPGLRFCPANPLTRASFTVV
jgi:tRNA(Ile)-lysidine synthase